MILFQKDHHRVFPVGADETDIAEFATFQELLRVEEGLFALRKPEVALVPRFRQHRVLAQQRPLAVVEEHGRGHQSKDDHTHRPPVGGDAASLHVEQGGGHERRR